MGRDQRPPSSRQALRPSPGEVQARLLRRVGHLPEADLEALQERVPAVRRAGAGLVRDGLQGARWVVLGAAELADGAARSRLRAVDEVAADVVAPPLALVGAAAAARGLPRLGLPRAVPARLRPLHVPGARRPRVR